MYPSSIEFLMSIFEISRMPDTKHESIGNIVPQIIDAKIIDL